jgi:hypothetical protein
VEQDVGLVANDPAVGAGWNVDEVADFHQPLGAVVHLCDRLSAEHETASGAQTRSVGIESPSKVELASGVPVSGGCSWSCRWRTSSCACGVRKSGLPRRRTTRASWPPSPAARRTRAPARSRADRADARTRRWVQADVLSLYVGPEAAAQLALVTLGLRRRCARLACKPACSGVRPEFWHPTVLDWLATASRSRVSQGSEESTQPPGVTTDSPRATPPFLQPVSDRLRRVQARSLPAGPLRRVLCPGVSAWCDEAGLVREGNELGAVAAAELAEDAADVRLGG